MSDRPVAKDASGAFAALDRRLDRSPFRVRLALGAAGGAAAALAQPPWGLWPLILIGIGLAHLSWRGMGPQAWKAQFAFGWAVGAGYFTVSLHWIVEPFLVDAARHGWLAPLALVSLCGGLALFWGAAFALARAAAQRLGATAFGAACWLAFFWSLAEIARSFVFTGFPWALPAYAWMDQPPAQIVSVIGPFALSALTIAAGVSLTVRPLAAPAICLALIAGAWGYGEARLASEAATATPDGAVIRILQTGVDQNEKWAPENIRPNLEMLIALSTRPPARPDAPPALAVWPESAVTFLIDRDEAAVIEIADRLGGIEVATGALRAADGPKAPLTPETRWRNSLFLVEPTARLSSPYDKLHLVPFGEYLPFDDLFNRLGVVALGSLAGGLVAGDGHKALTPLAAPPFAPLICYEMIFPRATMAASETVSWMALVTNDSWFGGGAGLVQHLAKARMRAIETGVPIARSANAGVSAMIDPFGRASAAPAPPGEEGIIDAPLPRRVETVYRSFGEFFTTLGLILIFVAATAARKRPDA